MRFRRLSQALFAFCYVIAVHAQTAPLPSAPSGLTVSKVLIVITDPYCSRQPGASIVIDDYDRFPYPLSATGSQQEIETPGFQFDATTAHASLRFPAMRTDCVRAKPDWARKVAIFTFADCNREPVWNVTIRAESPIDISYVRRLGAARRPDVPSRVRRPVSSGNGWVENVDVVGDTPREDVPCRERGSFSSDHAYTVLALRHPYEQLDLQPLRAKPDPDLAGLNVGEILRLARDLGKGQSMPLDSDAMVHVLAAQRARGKGGPPNFSVVSMELDVRNLKETPVIHLAVEKVGQQGK
jgi:hypothetical protein